MFSKKDNGRLKVNWDAVGVLIAAVVIVISGILGYGKLQGQTELTANTVAVIEKNTTEKVEGTLKSDVEKNREINAIQDGKIDVLESKLNGISEAQKELKVEMRRSNKELKDMMNIIIQKLN